MSYGITKPGWVNFFDGLAPSLQYLHCVNSLSLSHWYTIEDKLCYHTMIVSSNGNIFLHYWPFVRGIHRSLCDRWFPSQRPVMWSFDVFFDLRLNKWLSKQSRCWWFEMPSWSLWHHRNATITCEVVIQTFKPKSLSTAKISTEYCSTAYTFYPTSCFPLLINNSTAKLLIP